MKKIISIMIMFTIMFMTVSVCMALTPEQKILIKAKIATAPASSIVHRSTYHAWRLCTDRPVISVTTNQVPALRNKIKVATERAMLQAKNGAGITGSDDADQIWDKLQIFVGSNAGRAALVGVAWSGYVAEQTMGVSGNTWSTNPVVIKTEGNSWAQDNGMPDLRPEEVAECE